MLQRTLTSAYLSASPQDFIQCSIEAMSPKIQIPHQERVSILENLWKVFQSVAPVSANQITPELKQQWFTNLSEGGPPIILDLDKISELIDVRVTFQEAEIKFEEVAELTLFVHSLVEVPLKLKSFALIIADSKTHYKLKARVSRKLQTFKDGQFLAEEGGEEAKPFAKDAEFMMEPDSYYEIWFRAEPKQFMENEELQVAKLEIKMGTDKRHVILTKSALQGGQKLFKASPKEANLLQNVLVKAHCYIKPT